MPCRSNGPGFVFLVIDNPDMSLEARRAVQRNLMRCRFVHGVFGSKVSPLIELIFNLHSIVGFRCKVPLLFASFLRATNGMRGWIRRPDFGLRGPDVTRRDNHPCSHRKAADLDRSDQKPVEAAARSPVPASIPSQRVRFHASGNHGVGFQWLLIEIGALGAPGRLDRRCDTESDS